MVNITSYPLEDNFETTLSQQWTGGTGTVNVTSTPNFTFPSGITTYIVANPWKSNMQIAEIDSYDSWANTLNVSNITLEKGASVNSTAQTHAVWNKIIISDNYQFWKDIADAVNSKIDGRVQWIYFFADATARDAELWASPATDGLFVWLTTESKITYSLWGAWVDVGTGATFVNASTTVAGKVEIATDAEVTAWTWTGWTGAVLSVTPTQVNKSVSLATTDTTSDETDYYVFQDAAASDVNKKILKSDLRNDLAASDTLKGTVEQATDAEIVTWTDTTRMVNPSQLKTVVWHTSISWAWPHTIAHGLPTTPAYIRIKAWLSRSGSATANDRTIPMSQWYYDGTTNSCIYNGMLYSGSEQLTSWTNANILHIPFVSGTSSVASTATATLDGTNATLTMSATSGTVLLEYEIWLTKLN